jgi:coenzyme PQQ biosynthesis protein PqqD
MASVNLADGMTSGAPRRGEHIVARRGDDAVILLDPDSGHYYTLDDVGGRIWELCDGSRSVDEIADLLAAEYDAPAERIRADVIELLSELREGRLVSY